MKTTKRIRDKKEVIKKFITGMYESICMQKELLELLLQVIEEEGTNTTPSKEEPRELIKGISGLAEFLGCGSTKAQNIMNSGILQEREIAYRAGNRWRYNKTLLAELLQEEPEIFNRSYSEVE